VSRNKSTSYSTLVLTRPCRSLHTKLAKGKGWPRGKKTHKVAVLSRYVGSYSLANE